MLTKEQKSSTKREKVACSVCGQVGARKSMVNVKDRFYCDKCNRGRK